MYNHKKRECNLREKKTSVHCFRISTGDFKGHSGITSAFRAAVYSRRLGEPPFRRMWESSIHSETKQPCQPVIVRGAVGHTVEVETIS